MKPRGPRSVTDAACVLVGVAFVTVGVLALVGGDGGGLWCLVAGGVFFVMGIIEPEPEP